MNQLEEANATHAMALDTTLSESVPFPVLAAETAGLTAGATVATWQKKCKSGVSSKDSKNLLYYSGACDQNQESEMP